MSGRGSTCPDGAKLPVTFAASKGWKSKAAKTTNLTLQSFFVGGTDRVLVSVCLFDSPILKEVHLNVPRSPGCGCAASRSAANERRVEASREATPKLRKARLRAKCGSCRRCRWGVQPAWWNIDSIELELWYGDVSHKSNYPRKSRCQV